MLLQDHVVHGSVLLPTAWQLALVLEAVRGRLDAHTGLRLSDLTVEDPVLLVPGSTRAVRVEGVLPSSTETGCFAVRSPDGARHLAVQLARRPAPGSGSSEASREAAPPDLLGSPGLVYPPLFHGPAFQVVGRLGHRGPGLVTQLRTGLPAWDPLPPAAARVARLVELLMQSCGVWELTRTGQMMRPHRIDRLDLHPLALEPLHAGQDVRAEVRPRSDTDLTRFDGVARDAQGRELVRLHGYAPVALGPPKPGVVRRLARHLGPAPTLDSRNALDSRSASYEGALP